MPDKKLTDNLSNNSPNLSNGLSDNEIVKALECCLIDNIEYCGVCRYSGSMGNCVNDLMRDALDLINRQKAENERLKYLLEREEQATLSLSKQFYKDGVKEFAEKVKSELKNISNFDFHGTLYYMVGEAFFDNLLKELVGDENG